jgi:putative ABC transport system permease protein
VRLVAHLTWAYLRHRPGPTLLLAAALGLVLWLPIASRLVVQRFEAQLMSRAEATPLVAGAPGSRFDLVLSSLYFRGRAADPIDAAHWDALAEAPEDVLCVPIHRLHTLREAPLVGTTPEYQEQRGLRIAAGEEALFLGEVALGAKLAERLGLGPGATVYSDPPELYDLAQPPSIELTVTGVYAPTGTPDDEAAFTGLQTCWMVDGLVHGHVDAETGLPPELVLGGNETETVVSPAMSSVQKVTPENLSSFHTHGAREDLPLSSVLLFPASDKDRTLLRTRVAAKGPGKIATPTEVVGELLGFAVRLQRLIDVLALLIGAGTATLAGLVLALSARLRAAELRTLDRMGATRTLGTQLLTAHAGVAVLGALLIAGALLLPLLWILEDPTRWL